MNNNIIFGLAASAVGSLVLAGSASAGLNGISWTMSTSAWGDTYLIYADVNAGDQVDAVFGDAASPLSINAIGSSFYQNIYGGPTSININPAFFPVFPSLAYDSWVTIGLTDMTGNAMLNIGIDWTAFEAGGSITTSNGSWFATPADAQVFEVGGKVLLGQFTVDPGFTHTGVEGWISMQGKDADLNNWTARDQYFNTVPAPGALALLGIAGLAARRRRK